MRNPVMPCALPDGALLQRYRDIPGAYTDCLSICIPQAKTISQFIDAFYTTWLFKCERTLLGLIGRGANDADVHRLATGEAQTFAAWTVEARTGNQILLRDFLGASRSWLMVTPEPGSAGGSRFYFGSAIVPRVHGKSDIPRLGASFGVMLNFHKPYARALLRAAASKLSRSGD